MFDVAYSYHTFIYPFAWKTKGNAYKKLVNCIEKNPNWVCQDLRDVDDITASGTKHSTDEYIELYKEFQYFHEYSRKAIFGFEEGIVQSYAFQPEEIQESGRYIIKKDGLTYDLKLNAIRLLVYNTEVALFVLECENYNYRTIEDAKKINDYGRRVTLPFLNKTGYTITADSLTIHTGSEEFTSDFQGVLSGIRDETEAVTLTHVSDLVRSILGYGTEYSFSSKKCKNKKVISLYPIMGDRMYVAAYIIDENTTRLYMEYHTKHASPEVRDEIEKSIYELAYIDGGECTCCDSKMRKALVKQATYRRWLDLGSISYFSNYSIITLTNSGWDILAENFLIEYVPMFCLVIAQRASIIRFKCEVAEVSKGMEKRGKKIKKAQITRIMDLQERFVAFDSQLCYDEVSPEQQGIELYTLIKEKLMIDQEKATLKDQLDAVYNTSNTAIQYSINTIIYIFTWIGAILTLLGLREKSSGELELLQRFIQEWGIAVGAFLVCVPVVIVISAAYRRRK